VLLYYYCYVSVCVDVKMCRLVIVECGLRGRRVRNGYVTRTECLSVIILLLLLLLLSLLFLFSFFVFVRYNFSPECSHCVSINKLLCSLPMALGSTQPLTEMSTRNISWGVKAAGA
jgi:hypothetical protein